MKQFRLLFLFLLISLMGLGDISAHVQLDYPVGGETFKFGETVTLEWHILISHNQENWDLYFSPDGGTNWETIQMDLPESQLNYQWTVPQVATEQALVKIYMDNSGVDYEDASDTFTIQESTSSVRKQTAKLRSFALYANYPNPFNPTTLISYELKNISDVRLTIYNQSGQEIKTLVKKEQTVGFHQVQWDGRDSNGESVASGVYLYQFKSGSFIRTRKMVLLK